MGEGKAIFGSLGSASQVPSSYEIGVAVSTLDSRRIRLNKIHEDFEGRAKKKFELCVDALVRGQKGRAEVYAEEIASLKKLIRIISYHECVLEQVLLRLETISEMGQVSSGLRSDKAVRGYPQVASQICEEFADTNEVVCSRNLEELGP